jgi:hypothetical protein
MRSGGKDNVEPFGRWLRQDDTKSVSGSRSGRLYSNIADHPSGADHASLHMRRARIDAPPTTAALQAMEYPDRVARDEEHWVEER